MRLPGSPSAFLLCASTALAGCFDPAVPTDTEDVTETDTSPEQSSTGTPPGEEGTDSTTDGGDTLDPDEGTQTGEPADGTATDSTGATDEPPQITNFTVQGSSRPLEVVTAQRVTLDVDATDDIGIERAEFYDGETLVGVSTESPFTAEVLLTSADNGSHAFSVQVFDAAEQSDTSDEVLQSVNISGGAQLELQSDIVDIRVSYKYRPEILFEDGDIHLFTTGYRPGTGAGDLVYRRFSDTFSSLGDWPVPSRAGIDSYTIGVTPPSISGDTYVIGGTTVEDDQWEAAAFVIDRTTGATTRFPLAETNQFSTVSVMQDGGDNIVYLVNNNTLVKTSGLGAGGALWTRTIEGSFGATMALTPDDEIIVGFGATDCAPGSDVCARKYSPTGEVMWTRALVSPGASANLVDVAPDGTIAITGNPSAPGPATLFILDQDGGVTTSELPTPDTFELYELRFDPQLNLLIGGRDETIGGPGSPDGWIARVTTDGAQIWAQSFPSIGADSEVASIVALEDGRLFIAGNHDRFAENIIDRGSRAFLAQLEL